MLLVERRCQTIWDYGWLICGMWDAAKTEWRYVPLRKYRSRQVAYLHLQRILAQQIYNTFVQRMKNFGTCGTVVQIPDPGTTEERQSDLKKVRWM